MAALETSAPVKSAARVMEVLDLLARRREASFATISEELELPASSAHQLLRTMAAYGFVVLDVETKLYSLGFKVWEIGQTYSAATDLVALANTALQQITAVTGETAQFARLDGREVVYLAISESPQPMKLVSEVGKRLWAHGTALGKCLLATLSDEELEHRLAAVTLPRFTRNTIVSTPQLIEEMQRTRERGYAIDDEEYVVGCRCLAMPVRGLSGEAVAAMSVSIPTARYSQSLEEQALAELSKRSVELSRKLGFVDPA